MGKRGNFLIFFAIAVLLWMTAFGFRTLRVSAHILEENPYVSFSPDKRAFTVNAFDRNYEWYENGTTVDTGVKSSLRELEKGEHYYKVSRRGMLPVGTWRVVHKAGRCCHSDYPPAGQSYHGIQFGRSVCGSPYYSGWFPYCADCGENLLPNMVYMSREAAASLKVLDTSLDYYYLCPACNNLEQGVALGQHWCRAISWNRYQVRYESNAPEKVGGYMESSFHMYNNERIYEGREVTPSDRLLKNTYVRIGYEFAGWNTKPDGSGRDFADQEKIWNLTEENYDGTGSGVVVLYAQWEKSGSLLRVDPAGGSYLGKEGITEVPGEYGTSYTLDVAALMPPKGATVSFETNGGEKIPPITGEMFFEEWQLVEPFRGRLTDNVYYFTAGSGNVDTAKALYDRAAVTLPKARKEGSSFGGWYSDPQCSVPVGDGGDRIVPRQDTVLYAKWVDLVLKAEDNYSANGGKGAVDLTWAQNDGRSKAYMVYQSTDNRNWTLISDSGDEGSKSRVEKTFSYSGKTQTYTVPETGLYTFIAQGAQGTGYGSHKGGLGGRVEGKVWLEKGEKLTCEIGGQSGYNGGGRATDFGGGGGCTSIVSDRKGTLIVAGGGGGATSVTDGQPGGSSASNLKTGLKGADGAAGGGGGYRGGEAGQAIFHRHTEQCFVKKDTSYTLMSYPDYLSPWAQSYGQMNLRCEMHGAYYADGRDIWNGSAHGKGPAEMTVCIGEYVDDNWNRLYLYIPTEGNSTLNIHAKADAHGGPGYIVGGSLTVWNQNGEVIYQKNLGQVKKYTGYAEDVLRHMFETETGGERGSRSGWCAYHDFENYTDESLVYWNETVALPEGTSGVRIAIKSTLEDNSTWFGISVREISFSGVRQIKTCPYEENQLLSSKPAYGGSSYVNPERVSDYTQSAGKCQGNGSFSLQSVKVGYRSELSAKGVKAQDMAAPDKVDVKKITKSAVGESALSLSWKEPRDNGTDYYHRAESYLTGSGQVLSHSNVTKNTLTSGVAGYYCLVDQNAGTPVNEKNGTLVRKNAMEIVLTAARQYFHIAAVDKAGNVGASVHVEIGKEDEEVAWPLWTEKMTISSGEGSVFPAGEDAYYVRADGKTPFRLDFEGFLLGQASDLYQINHLCYHIQAEGSDMVTLDVATPRAAAGSSVVVTDASGVVKTVTGRSELLDDSYTITRRSDGRRRLAIEQRFTMEASMDGRKMQVTPSAGADFGGRTVTSDWDTDCTHGLLLIGDGTPPDIAGTEAIEEFEETDPADGERTLHFSAEDGGSGLKEFYAVISNVDNGSRREFTGEDGEITIVVSGDDELFQGNFMAEFYASDQVGNEAAVTCRGSNFALLAYVERVLEPHAPVFRCGESGCLNITAYGYPDRIEVTFPEEMTALDPLLNTVYEYDGTMGTAREQYLFMVPLRTPGGEFGITVTAWKDGRTIAQTPVIWTLGEDVSVLDDVRTRLR